uniref:Uncharacterized protein n=1 Tax=viral metagenome TaxID=1070528 RepID=A0A6C0BKS8_9ZZZZ
MKHVYMCLTFLEGRKWNDFQKFDDNWLEGIS